MKKKRELTKKEQEANLIFLKRVPSKLRKHKKLINGRVTKEDLILLISSLWKGFSKIKVKVPRLDNQGYYRMDGNNEVMYKKVTRRYKNIPAFGTLHKLSRKVLTGMYGSHLDLARKEGLV